MVRVEFTVEPFVEGRPGPHVRAAVEAASRLGVSVEFGPFGSTCEVADDDVGALTGAITSAALANGASHVNVHVEQLG